MRTLTPQKKDKKPGQQVKKSSKKVIKTTFNDPFHYRIRTLEYEDSQLLEKRLCYYFDQLRKQGKFKPAIVKQKFISFNEKKQSKKGQRTINPPLQDQNLVIGINSNLKVLKKANQKQFMSLIIIFYEERKHSILEQLLCHIIHRKIPYILTRDNMEVNNKFGVKTLSAFGIRGEEHKLFKELYQLSSKTLVEIPWVVQRQWMPLRRNKD